MVMCSSLNRELCRLTLGLIKSDQSCQWLTTAATFFERSCVAQRQGWPRNALPIAASIKVFPDTGSGGSRKFWWADNKIYNRKLWLILNFRMFIYD